MNEYRLTYSTTEGNAQLTIIERSEAAARKAFKANHKGAEISDIELIDTDAIATKDQERETLRYLRKDQLFSLSRLRFGTGENQFRQDIRQLCYLNRLMETEIFVLLPGRRRDDGVISAVDVMLQFAAGR